MNTPNILLVDDEEGIRTEIKGFLSDRVECNITEASNGYQALDELKQNDYDLLLIDVQMPGINGKDVIKKMFEMGKNTDIIVVTGWNSPEIIKEFKELGVEYMPKQSFSYDVLYSSVSDKLKKRNKLLSKSNN